MIIQFNQQNILVYDGGKQWISEQPWIVLLHGAQNDHSVWQEQAEWLANAGWNVVVPDLPAHGQSNEPANLSIPEMAAWTAQLLNTIGLRNAIVAGHSMGSLIALELAITQKFLCRQLILLGTALPMPVSPQLLTMCRDQPSEAIRLIAKWSHNPAKAQTETSNAEHIIRLQHLMESIHQKNSGTTLHTDMNACNDYQPDLAAIREINCPVHLIAGEADKMTPLKAAQAAVTQFRHAELHIIPAAGHALMTESAMETAQTLRRIITNKL